MHICTLHYVQTRWLITTKAGHHLLHIKQLLELLERLLGLMSYLTLTSSGKCCSRMTQKKDMLPSQAPSVPCECLFSGSKQIINHDRPQDMPGSHHFQRVGDYEIGMVTQPL